MRELIVVPIVHSQIDMGSAKEKLAEITKNALGTTEFEHHQAAIKRFWANLDKKFGSSNRQWPKTRIYQEGLPSVNEELIYKIIEGAADKGSVNYILIRKLITKGAMIEGTEDSTLLTEAWDLIQKATKGEINPSDLEKGMNEIESKRDEFIADRINKTLKEGETGLLFLGAHHHINMLLDTDIVVKSLDF